MGKQKRYETGVTEVLKILKILLRVSKSTLKFLIFHTTQTNLLCKKHKPVKMKNNWNAKFNL